MSITLLYHLMCSSPPLRVYRAEHDETSAIERILRHLWQWQEMRHGEVLPRQRHLIGHGEERQIRSRERMKQLDQVVFERKVGGRVARGNV